MSLVSNAKVFISRVRVTLASLSRSLSLSLSLSLPFFFVPVGMAYADAGSYQKVKPGADGIGKSYMGREIAGVMGWLAAAWLERPERDREERPDLLAAELKRA